MNCYDCKQGYKNEVNGEVYCNKYDVVVPEVIAKLTEDDLKDIFAMIEYIMKQ